MPNRSGITWTPGESTTADLANPDLAKYWEGAEDDWYPDPTDSSLIRYWDGSRWTDLVTPRPPSSSLVGSGSPPARPMPVPTPRPHEVRLGQGGRPLSWVVGRSLSILDRLQHWTRSIVGQRQW